MDFTYNDFNTELDNANSTLESLLVGLDDIATEADATAASDGGEGKVSPSVWEKIKKGFETMINTLKGWISTAVGKARDIFGGALKKVQDFFKKAQRDRENAHEYLASARAEVDKAKADVAAAKAAGDKDVSRQAKTDLKNAKDNYAFQNKVAKREDRNAAKAHNAKQRMYNKMARKGWGKSEESYIDDGFDMTAVDEAFADYYDTMAVEGDPSLANALESLKTNVDIYVTSAEECDTFVEKFSNEVSQFNRDVQTLKIATENYQADGDKDAFKTTTAHAIEHLKKSYEVLKLAPATEGAAFGEDHIGQIHNFFVGAQDIIAEKAASFGGTDDFGAGNESFLASLID